MTDALPRSLRVQIAVMRRITAMLRAIGLRDAVFRWRRRRSRHRRLRAEARGSDRLSHPALHDLDRKLDAIIDRDGGFFVEAGANDGFTQSNTYWLERFRGWSGVLVEPMQELYEEACVERPGATVVRAALVPFDHEGETLSMVFGDLMSTVNGTHGTFEEERTWVTPGLVLGWRDAYEAEVPARTLNSILDEVGAPEVDLLSLDVEGFEPQVLRGLDLSRHAPRYVLVEMHDVDAGRSAIEAVIGEQYEVVGQLSPMDVLYRRQDLPPSGPR